MMLSRPFWVSLVLMSVMASAHAQVPPAAAPAVALPTVAAPATVPTTMGDSGTTPPAAATAPDGSPLPVMPAATTDTAPIATTPGVPMSLIPGVTISGDSTFSYGNIPYSLMFTPDQIANMKNALATYETVRRTRGSGDILVEEAIAPSGPTVTEPNTYPVFTLASIAYKSKTDWTIWIGGVRITPKTNTQIVHVVSVAPNKATFTWDPEYMSFIVRRAQEHKFAPTDPVKHKLTQPNTAVFDTQARRISFTLKPNQSFSGGHMATFEGRINPPSLEPLTPLDANGMPTTTETSGMTGAVPSTGAPVATSPLTPGLGSDAIARMYKNAGGTENISPTTPQTTMDNVLQNHQTAPAAPTVTAAPAPVPAVTNP